MVIWLSPANSQCEFAPNSQYCEFQAEFGANSRCERIRSEFGEFKLNSLRICIPTEARIRSLWGVEPRTKAICKVETTKDIVDGLVDFYNLVFYFILFRLVSMRATLPLCTRAHMQALMTRVGGDNLTIGCMFESTYYGPTPKVFTHIFAPQGPKDMLMPISPIYALFPINSVHQGLRC